VYSASWDGKPVELFSTRLGSYEARPLGLGQGRVAAISGPGDLAVVFEKDPHGFAGGGMLSRVPLAGGVPRELVDDVEAADWDRTGSELAVVIRWGTAAGQFSVGDLEVTTASWVRVSPDDQPGGARACSMRAMSSCSMERLPEGNCRRMELGLRSRLVPGPGEIWFTATRRSGARTAISDAGGRERLLAAAPDPVRQDAFQDKALVIGISGRETFSCLAPGEAVERELGWFDGSSLEAISADGKTALYSGEDHAGGGSRAAASTSDHRRLRGRAARRQVSGRSFTRWKVSAGSSRQTAHSFVLYPTGAGASSRYLRVP
jgi:hypothetical protein